MVITDAGEVIGLKGRCNIAQGNALGKRSPNKRVP
jgi:hypothetical protein